MSNVILEMIIGAEAGVIVGTLYCLFTAKKSKKQLEQKSEISNTLAYNDDKIDS